MKKFRKGFTLLELLVVIGVMGLMSSMAMIGGQQATDAARANAIADSLEKAASAMMMYYSDNADEVSVNGVGGSGTIALTDLAAGASAYLKNPLLAVETGDNTYFVAVSDETANANWYVGYKFNTSDTAIRAIIANKATRMVLSSTKTGKASDTAYAGTTADGNTTYPDIVYMLVR